MIGQIKFIAWIALIFWAALYVSIQLDRLNKVSFAQAVLNIETNLNASKGVLRFFGLIIYSPYLIPGRSILAWIVVSTILMVL